MEENTTKIDYQKTLFLPHTNFPMRASLPEKEGRIVEEWKEKKLYDQLRRDAKGRPLYIVHDGPPYANGDIHVGHALNKILKDIIVRSFQMRGYDSNYVPGWDCHGLPIEWKIEEKYLSEGKKRENISVLDFRKECRKFADHWIKVQSSQFERLGIIGDFIHPYTTMDYSAESLIAEEFLTFVMSNQVYRSSKPVMWSVVERTSLAEAEVEYQEYESDVVWAQFPVDRNYAAKDLQEAFFVIWTTTPWTLPANRAIAFSPHISYGLYEVIEVEKEVGPRVGNTFLFADALSGEAAKKARITLNRLRSLSKEEIEKMRALHPFKGLCGGYNFSVPLLPGEHVTDDTGTGFVHTAPGHGREDFDLWRMFTPKLTALGIDLTLPFIVDDAGFLTKDAPGFGSQQEAVRIMDDQGKKGNANDKVIEALIERSCLFARGRLKHPYPHSWRSRKPVIFRNTPQWFIHMDKPLETGKTLREQSLESIHTTRFLPEIGKNRLSSMVKERPDWVVSRQRVWGVPLSIFIDKEGNILKDRLVNHRIIESFKKHGTDIWFDEKAKALFLGEDYKHEDWIQVRDILDVWFDSGTTHSFVLEKRNDLKWPADVYLEGSDQHRGWFQSSLLESCGTRHRAPYNLVITHGFTLDEQGRKMSKSRGNTIAPQDIINRMGADIFRLWVASVDYHEDQRLGDNILRTCVDNYRKIRNTIRWMLGILIYDTNEDVSYNDMPELERFMLHRITQLNKIVHDSYDHFDFKRVLKVLTDFMILELSSFYFDIRKDCLYCDSASSLRRKSCIQVLRYLWNSLTIWLAPILPFTTEEAWMEHKKDSNSIHLQQFPMIPDTWNNEELFAKWSHIKKIRRVIMGALEISRAEKKIGSSLEASPIVYITDSELLEAIQGIDLSEICITSDVKVMSDFAAGFCLPDVQGVSVEIQRALGKKCARSWRYTDDVGSDAEFPDVCARDAKVLREMKEKGIL